MTSDHDPDLLRVLRAAEDAAPVDGDCLSSEQLAALAQGEAATADRTAAVAHLETCAECSSDLAMLFELEPWLDGVSATLASGLEASRKAAAETGRASGDLGAGALGAGTLGAESLGAEKQWRRLVGKPWLLVGPLVAAAVVLLMVVAWPTAVTPPPEGVVRSLDPAVTPEPDATLDAGPSELVWPAEPEVGAYRVRVFDAAGSLLIDRSVPAAEGSLQLSLQLTEEERELLAPGGSYFWVVDAEAGSPERRIGPHWFHVDSPR